MRQKISEWTHKWIPLPAKEDLSYEHDTFLEYLFYVIINDARRISHREKFRYSETSLNKIVNLGIIFVLLFFISSAFLAIPVLFSNNNSEKFKFIFQMGIILLLGSIAWTSYVYICQEFKNLIRSKIIIELNRQDGDGFKAFLFQYFNGISLVWHDRYRFRIYRRDFFIGLFVITGGVYLSKIVLSNPTYQIISPVLLEAILQIIILFVPLCLLLFIVFVIFSIITTVILNLVFLLVFVWLVPIEIRPYIDLGGTAPYGTMIIHGLYTAGVAISLLPLLVLTNQIDFNKIITGYSSLQNIENQSVDSLIIIVTTAANDSFHDITIGSVTKYSQWIFLFIIIVIIGLMVVFTLHYRIKQRKNEEMCCLESMLSSNNLNNPENFLIRDRNHYLLSLYTEVKNLHEWPVKQIFLVELLFSFALLFIPALF